MPAAYWNKDERFKRIGEGGEGAVGQGSFGEVFQGFDELKQEAVFIKRQRKDTDQAAKEMACYNMLEAFPHPNIIRMCGMWTGQFQEKTYLYIAMESCSTTLWKYIRVDNPRAHHEFKRCGGQHQLLLDIVRAVGHLHAHGITHGDVSMSNILLTAAGVVRLADFGTVSAHTYLTPQRLCVAYIRPP
jgi:serine/threonine protein kinase